MRKSDLKIQERNLIGKQKNFREAINEVKYQIFKTGIFKKN